MRVIEPKDSKHSKKHGQSNHRRDSLLWPLLTILVIGVVWVVAYEFRQTNKQPASGTQEAISLQNNIPDKPKTGNLKIYTSQQFADLYKNFAYPNTQRIDENTPITTDITADKKIKELAVARGYEIRSAPVTDAFQAVSSNMLLQERAAKPLQDMVAKAKSEGQLLTIIAAYRSSEDQKQIFTDRLAARKIPIPLIASGNQDKQILDVLKSTAVPGFSRHHTGYTIDIACENDPSVIFEKSSCYSWLSADNFKMAKSYGWIPSYPPGLTNQGPDPEPWEFVWVGANTLTE